MTLRDCLGLALALWLAPSELVRRRLLAMQLDTLRHRAAYRDAIAGLRTL
jgi:hypothetical protein